MLLEQTELTEELAHAPGKSKALPGRRLGRGVVSAEDHMKRSMPRRQQTGQNPEQSDLSKHLPSSDAMLRGSARREPRKHVGQQGCRQRLRKACLSTIRKADKTSKTCRCGIRTCVGKCLAHEHRTVQKLSERLWRTGKCSPHAYDLQGFGRELSLRTEGVRNLDPYPAR